MSDFAGFIMGGFAGAGAFFIIGMKIAPVKNAFAKFSLIFLIVVMGIYSGIAGWNREDKLECATGFTAVLIGLAFIRMKRDEIDKLIKND